MVFFSLIGNTQERLSLQFNLTQSNNNYTFSDLFPEQTTFESPIILATNDQYGVSARKSKENGRFYEILLASTIYRRTVEHLRPVSILEDNRIITSTNFDLHLRLEIGNSMTFPSLPNLYFGLSASLDPRLAFRDYDNHQSSFFPFNTMSFETSFLVNPQIEYSINDRIIFLLKMPLQVFTLNSLFVESLDPNLARGDQRFYKQFIDFLHLSPTYTIGVGYYLSHENR
jgi:hypothetical protein